MTTADASLITRFNLVDPSSLVVNLLTNLETTWRETANILLPDNDLQRFCRVGAVVKLSDGTIGIVVNSEDPELILLITPDLLTGQWRRIIYPLYRTPPVVIVYSPEPDLRGRYQSYCKEEMLDQLLASLQELLYVLLVPKEHRKIEIERATDAEVELCFLLRDPAWTVALVSLWIERNTHKTDMGVRLDDRLIRHIKSCSDAPENFVSKTLSRVLLLQGIIRIPHGWLEWVYDGIEPELDSSGKISPSTIERVLATFDARLRIELPQRFLLMRRICPDLPQIDWLATAGEIREQRRRTADLLSDFSTP